MDLAQNPQLLAIGTQDFHPLHSQHDRNTNVGRMYKEVFIDVVSIQSSTVDSVYADKKKIQSKRVHFKPKIYCIEHTQQQCIRHKKIYTFIHCTLHKMIGKFQSPSQTMLRCLIHVVNALYSSSLSNTIRSRLRWSVLAFLLNYHKCINTSSLISCANGNSLTLNSAKTNKYPLRA